MSRAVVVTQAQQLQEKLKIKKRKIKEKTYNNCFVGTHCLKLIINLKFASNEQDAIDFGNKLIQYNIIQHVERHHTFKNEKLYYQFIPGYDAIGTAKQSSIASDTSTPGSSRSARKRLPRPTSGSSRLTANPRHRTGSSNFTISSVSDLLSGRNGQKFIRRKDVYFRVNKYMRRNRLTDAHNFLRDSLKYVAGKASTNIDWSVLQGPTLDNIDINHIDSATQEKYLQDTMGESRACWIDVTVLECKLKLFYELNNDNNGALCRECINKLTSILNALQRSLDATSSLIVQSYYYRFIECEARACLAYAIVKSNKIGYAAYAGLALEQCRKAMKLDAFHSLSHAMYGYLLDRCLDKFEEARQYLEYAIHLNNYYDSVNVEQKEPESKEQEKEKKKKHKSYHRFAFIHIWLASLLVNFEEEFREIEYKMEKKLRAEIKKKYEAVLNKKNKTDELESDDAVFSDNESISGTGTGTGRGRKSILLVKQLSHAQTYHRQRASITRILINHMNGGAEAESLEFANFTSPATQMQNNLSSASFYDHDPDVETPRAESPSTSMFSDLSPPHQLAEDTSANVQHMIAERLSDDTLTKHIGERFGSEFLAQMKTIPSKPGEHFEIALELEPQNGRFHSVYGAFLIQLEKFENAKPHFEKSIKYDANNIVSLNNLGWILSLTRFSQYQQAKNYLSKAAKLRPKNAIIQFNLARLLAHAFGDEQIQNAKRYYLAALMNDNANCHIHYFYALFLRFIVKDNESAKQHLEKSKQCLAAAMSDNEEFSDVAFEVNGYIEHAKILQHESRFKAARFLLQRAAKLDITKKREISQLLQHIQEEERELDMLKRGY